MNTDQTPSPSAVTACSPLIERIDEVLFQLRGELLKACTKHAPMHSPHEGYAVILEEVDELWDHVKADTGRTFEARKEALQIAAMGIRYVLDLNPAKEPAKEDRCDCGYSYIGHLSGCPALEEENSVLNEREGRR